MNRPAARIVLSSTPTTNGILLLLVLFLPVLLLSSIKPPPPPITQHSLTPPPLCATRNSDQPDVNNNVSNKKQTPPKIVQPSFSVNITTSDTMDDFFRDFTNPQTGWINVAGLDVMDIATLRTQAKAIMGREIVCGYPKVSETTTTTTTTIPQDKDRLEYCFWASDIVSAEALSNFSFEKSLWEWVVRMFATLHHNRNTSLEDDVNTDPVTCPPFGFLDIGVNVGDWISPIRLLSPHVPMYGIEGSPGTAAIATANFRTSIEYHKKKKTKPEAVSFLLPYSLTNPAQLESIQMQGGVCFSKPQFIGGRYQKDNIGGRFVEGPASSRNNNTNGRLDCEVSSGAGATTLDYALRGLPTCPHLTWPRIYIAKMDVEGFEFKALSSVVQWLSEQPPCYLMFEHYNRPSYTALIELFLNVGYDVAWRTRNGEFPMGGTMWTQQQNTMFDIGSAAATTATITTPWWSLKEHGDTFQTLASQHTGRGYTELILGFANEKACLERMK